MAITCEYTYTCDRCGHSAVLNSTDEAAAAKWVQLRYYDREAESFCSARCLALQAVHLWADPQPPHDHSH